MPTATASGFISSLSGLPDQVLLAHTRSLVLHEQALQLAVLDHLREIQARHLHLRLGFSSLFDYAVRELGYSEGAAWRRIKAMRLCTETAGTRERLQDGSLTLSAAAQLQNTFDLLQRTATATVDRGSAPAAPELLPGGTRTAPGAGAPGAGAPGAAAPARPVPALDAAQRQELVAQASGKSTREVKQLLAGVAPEVAPPAERMRALGEDRWELKVVIDAACQRGIEQLRALLSHVDPHLTLGQLVERLVQDGLQRYDPGRPRRGRGGGRREASAGQAPEPQAQQGPAGGATSPAKRSAQEQPGVPPTPAGTVARGRTPASEGASADGSTPAPAARSAEQLGVPPTLQGTVAGGSTARAALSAEEPVRGMGGAGTSARAALPAEEPVRGMGGAGTSARAALPARPPRREACGGSTPVHAKPAATAPDTATSAAKSAADPGAHATVPTPRPTLPADQSMPTALAAVNRGRSAASPAKRAGVALLDVRSRPAPAGPSGGSAQPPHRARRSRYIPAPVRREVWRRDGGCCSFVDPHSGRRCGSRFLLELDHIVPFALGGSAEPANLRLHCSAHHRFRHRQTERRHSGPRDRRLPWGELGGRGSVQGQRE